MSIALDHSPLPEDFRACDEVSRSLHRNYARIFESADHLLLPDSEIAKILPFRMQRIEDSTTPQEVYEKYCIRKETLRTKTLSDLSSDDIRAGLNTFYAVLERFPAILELAKDEKERRWIHSNFIFEVTAPHSIVKEDLQTLSAFALALIVHSLDIYRQLPRLHFNRDYEDMWRELLLEAAKTSHSALCHMNDEQINSRPELFTAALRTLEQLPIQLPVYSSVVSEFFQYVKEDRSDHGRIFEHLRVAMAGIFPFERSEEIPPEEQFEISLMQQAQRRLLTEALTPLAEEPEWLESEVHIQKLADASKIVEFRLDNHFERKVGIRHAVELAQSLSASGYRRWYIVAPEDIHFLVSSLRVADEVRSPRDILSTLNLYLRSPRNETTRGFLSFLDLSYARADAELRAYAQHVDFLYDFSRKYQIDMSFLWPDRVGSEYVGKYSLNDIGEKSVVIQASDRTREGLYAFEDSEISGVYIESLSRPRHSDYFFWRKEVVSSLYSVGEREGWDADSRICVRPEKLTQYAQNIEILVGGDAGSLEDDVAGIEGYQLKNPSSLYVFIRESPDSDNDGDNEVVPEPTGPVVSIGGPSVGST